MKNNFLRGIVYLGIFIILLGAAFATNSKNLAYLNSVKSSLLSGELFKSKSKVILRQSVVEEESAVIDVVDKVSPSVVSVIEKSVNFDPFSGPVSSENSIGTGFVVDSNGLIITNNHVVANSSSQYSIVTKDGVTYDVKKIHKDPLNDLALLEVDAKNLPAVELGDSSVLKVGQKAIAIGNALGEFSNTVTVGVVSGLGRQVTAGGFFGEDSKTYTDVIQTDAAVNPGNSGGPLLNIHGQVIGVNVATSRGAENISFAIPVNRIKPVIQSFEETGKIVRPYLGVSFRMIPKNLAQVRNLPEGAYVQQVGLDTPAEQAGLKVGDIITNFDGKPVNEKTPLDVEIQQNHKVGDTVKIVVNRQGSSVTLTATLSEAPEQ